MWRTLLSHERKIGNGKEDVFYPHRHLSFFRMTRVRNSIKTRCGVPLGSFDSKLGILPEMLHFQKEYLF